ncbi:MAG TPA: hypothetical protein PLW65_01460 [Pseudomonadota bacterium]|nr:hypothetical protein [Pseudomonadota bacterium]
MTRSTLRSLSLGLFVLLAACTGGGTTNTPSDPLCGRQRDNGQRCNPSRTACQLQADYDLCLATKALYRPEVETTYLTCYPATLGCDSASQDAALACAQKAEDQVPPSATFTTLANNTCQRCPGVANDGTTDPATCSTNLANDSSDLARALRFFNDSTLNRLNTCLTSASPPADGCVAFQACYRQLQPTPPTSSCADGGS